jgi:glycine betaine/proline transport system ATP-binding protein
MEEKNKRVVVEGLYKIFGPDPDRAFALIDQGKGKDEVFEETGLTIGVQNASFNVYDGEVFVIMGLSGSGKSTIVRMLNRLIEPTAGQVYIENKDIARMSNDELIEVRRKKMCMVFQSFALMPHMTVLKNAAFGLEVAGIDEKEREKRAMDALDQVGLKPYANSYPKELSGGMQQRVGLARGLAVDPTIMLMDEAFSALDPLIRTEMQDELLKLQQESQRTVIFISHDLDEAMRIGDRIAMMEGGRIVQVGTPEEILKNPADEYVKAFFRGVDPTNVLSAGDVARDIYPTIIRHRGEGLRSALERILEEDRAYAYVLDQQGLFQGVVSVDSVKDALDREASSLDQAFLDDVETVSGDSTLQAVLPVITRAEWAVPVVDEDNKYLGAISRNRFLRTLDRHTETEETPAA